MVPPLLSVHGKTGDSIAGGERYREQNVGPTSPEVARGFMDDLLFWRTFLTLYLLERNARRPGPPRIGHRSQPW